MKYYILLILFFTPSLYSQDLSYDDLLNELQYKRSRIERINSQDDYNQKAISLGMVSSLGEIDVPQGPHHPLLQGFELGYHSDLGSNHIEGRGLFRYFFESTQSQMNTSLRELAFQLAYGDKNSQKWKRLWGGGFSLRHILHDSNAFSVNEVAIQLNALYGVETKISSTSRLGFELGARFPFGVSGRDRFAIDMSIKLKTDFEN